MSFQRPSIETPYNTHPSTPLMQLNTHNRHKVTATCCFGPITLPLHIVKFIYSHQIKTNHRITSHHMNYIYAAQY